MYRCIQSWGVCEDDRWQVQGTLPKRGHTANHRAAPRARVDTRAGMIANMSTSLSPHIMCRFMTVNNVVKFCPISISEQQKLIDQGGGKVGHFGD